jgi:hypothetical protein
MQLIRETTLSCITLKNAGDKPQAAGHKPQAAGYKPFNFW